MKHVINVATIAGVIAPLFLLAYGCTAGSVSGPSTGDGGTTGNGGGGGGGGGGNGGGGSGGNGGGGTTTDGGGGKTIYCGAANSTECVCSTKQSSSLTADGTCTASTVGSPSLCCAISGWPSNGDDQGFGGCFCSKIFCSTDGDVCQCGFAAPSTGDTPVDSCSGGSGQICCRSKSDIAPTCACYKGTQCTGSNDDVVPSCSPMNLACADQTVTTCR